MRTACVVALGLGGAMAVPAMAQTNPNAAPPPAASASAPAAPVVLPAINVTAKGYAASALETPIATESLDREDLVRSGAPTVGDALRGRPGLAVASDGAQGRNPVIRGLKRESVVLLVDGMRLNSAQPAGAIASFMSLDLAERVELVKGPASVLYGTGALGGAINVRLPQARFEPGVSLSAGASVDSASRGLRGTGVLNLSQGDHALMLGASLADFDDYRAPTGRVDRTGYEADALIGQYRYRLDARQQLRVSLQQQRDEDVWYPGSTRPHPHPQVGSSTVHSPNQQRRLAEVGYEWRGTGERPFNLDLRAWRQEVERNIHSWANGALAQDIARTNVTFQTDGVDARADWAVHPQHLLSFGVNAWRMEAAPNRELAQPPAFAFQRNDPFADGRIEALGLYLQDDVNLGRLNLLAGLRHDRVKGGAASIANGAVTTGLSRSDSATSASLGAVYEVAPLLRPYVNVSRGFRAGEMRERFEASPRADGYYYIGNPQIRPETATQFELGLKGEDARISYSVAAYRTRIDDYITGRDVSGAAGSNGCPAANAGACKETVNLGRATLTGLEAALRWRYDTGRWLNLAFSSVRGTNDDLDEPLFQMPADELSIGWEGDFARGLRADATLRLVRRQDRVATVFARGTENATPGFATADLGATWRIDRRNRLRVVLRNLADKAYHEHLADGVSGQETLEPGRSLYVAWTGSF